MYRFNKGNSSEKYSLLSDVHSLHRWVHHGSIFHHTILLFLSIVILLLHRFLFLCGLFLLLSFLQRSFEDVTSNTNDGNVDGGVAAEDAKDDDHGDHAGAQALAGILKSFRDTIHLCKLHTNISETSWFLNWLRSLHKHGIVNVLLAARRLSQN